MGNLYLKLISRSELISIRLGSLALVSANDLAIIGVISKLVPLVITENRIIIAAS